MVVKNRIYLEEDKDGKEAVAALDVMAMGLDKTDAVMDKDVEMVEVVGLREPCKTVEL